MNKTIEEVIVEEMLGVIVDKTVEENIEIAIEMTVMTEAGTGLERCCFSEIMAIIELEAQATIDPGQDSELAQIGIEFIVISVGNMIILQGTVPTSRQEKEIEQLQQMLNLGDEQTSLTPPMSNAQDDCSRANSEQNLRANHSNFSKVGMALLHFYLSAPK